MELEFLYPSITLLAIALVLDGVLGDPVYPFHPVRLCGNALSGIERILRRIDWDGYGGGILLFFLLSFLCISVVTGVGFMLNLAHPWLAWLWHLYVVWSLIALGDLCHHGRLVGNAVAINDLSAARKHIGMLVGRDTDKMQGPDCCRATVESISENLTDGVITPIFFYALLGLPGIVLFKVVSTMDSMVGFKTPQYLRFGWCGARMDDLMNWIPARITWLLIAGVSSLLKGYSGKTALTVGWNKHAVIPGPNSGWSETAAAGALNLKLVGPIWQNGEKVVDLWVGPETGKTDASPQDIERMIRLSVHCTVLFSAGSSIALALAGTVLG